MVITEKHKAARKITQTIFIPLYRAIELEQEANRRGVSRNKLINSYIDYGMAHKDEVEIVETKLLSSVAGGRGYQTKTHPAPEAVVVEAVVKTTPPSPATTEDWDCQRRSEV